MLKINVKDETAPLKSVVLGIANDLGGTPTLEAAYDPKSKEHVRQGTFPKEEDLISEIEGFRKLLESHDIQVIRPSTMKRYNQIFARDIGFVVDKLFIRSHMLAPREDEINVIQHIIEQIDPSQVVETPQNARVEGGDVMPWNDHLFIGYSKKT